MKKHFVGGSEIKNVLMIKSFVLVTRSSLPVLRPLSSERVKLLTQHVARRRLLPTWLLPVATHLGDGGGATRL